jgi:hypothetical protein
VNAEQRVGDLLSAYLAGRGAGRPPAAEELCRDCPELLPELRRRIAAAEDMDQFVRAANRSATIAAAPRAGEFPSRLGEYAVLRVLGQGGMGAVLLADDTKLGRQVAVKVMLPQFAADRGARERFLREARAAAAIQHDHVVPIHHVGDDGGVPYLVMPLLQGESLDARLEREGVLPAAEVARVGREAAEGLAAAHERGVVHRDVKPSNLWLEAPAGRVKVLDFGLARQEKGAEGVTRSGAVLGTPAYMSPEQADGLRVDARSDLFSLGATLYRAATGRPAFDGPTLTAVLRAVAEHHPSPPAQVNPAVPAELSGLIMLLLAKNPDGRPPSARVVADDLAGARVGPPAHHRAATTVADTPPVAPPRAGRRILLASASVLLALGGVVGWFATRPGGLATDRGSERGGGHGLKPDAGLPEPLRVVALDVNHFERVGPDRATHRGVLGQSVVLPKLGDQVTVEARLSRPAYAYLVAFAPDGQVHLLSGDRPAQKADLVRYPAAVRSEEEDVRYGLSDGIGLYVFAVIASDDPLPPFEAVSATKWEPAAAAAGEVYRYDGEWVEPLARSGGLVRGERGPGEKALGASGGVARAGTGLRKAVPGGRVTAVGFGVAER